jgi:hypothetical protein
MVTHLASARVAVADLTGSNPNVLFEVGYRQALGMPLVLIAEQGKDVRPFDVAGERTLFYELGPSQGAEARRQLAEAIGYALSTARSEERVREVAEASWPEIAGAVAEVPRSASTVAHHELLHLVERPALRRPVLELARAVSAAQKEHPDLPEEARNLLALEANYATEHGTHTLREVGEGRARRPTGDSDLLVALVRKTRHEIRATTEPGDVEWWGSLGGQLFLSANASAIRDRQVRIRRLFHCLGDEFEDIIDEQKRKGVDCYVLNKRHRGAENFHNCTLFDDWIMHVDEGQGLGRRNQLFLTWPARIREERETFENLIAAAKRV